MILIKNSTSRDWYVPKPHEDVKSFFNDHYQLITEIKASGIDLIKCLNILGRTMPTGEKSYIFIGDNAKEIAANWF